jgi:hypothetical protein
MSSKEKQNWVWADATSSTQETKSEADSFQGNKDSQIAKEIINLVREATQNTLDASPDQAKISFQYYESNIARSFSKYFSGLKDFIKESNKQERVPSDISNDEFDHPDWIVIQDFGTGGIEGEPSMQRQGNPLWEFLLNWGKSNKNETRASRGSKGQGRQTFLFASKIKSAFVLTYQEGFKRILSGMAFLNPTQEGNVYRGSQAIFAQEAISPVYKLHSGGIDGITDDEKDFVDGFESHFKLNFEENQTGTAIIIPLPLEKVKSEFLNYAAAGLIENFAPAIIRGDLSATVEEEDLTFENIEHKARTLKQNFSGEYKAFKRNAPQYIKFLIDAIHLEDTLNIDVGDPITFVDEQTINDDQKELILSAFNNEKIVKVRFNFQIKRTKDGRTQNQNTYIEAVLGAPDSPNEGVEMYFRSGMFISQQQRRCGSNFNAALFCNDKPISDLLNAAEDTGHTQWIKDSTKIEQMGFDQAQGSSAVVFCAFSLRNIIRTCFEDNATENLDAFDDLFLFDTDDIDARYRREARPTPEETPAPNPTSAPSPPPTYPGPPPCHNISDLSDGFRIKHIEGRDLPEQILVTLVYKQDPTVRRSKEGFDFDHINCESSGCSVIEVPIAKGKLQFKLVNFSNEFLCDVKNFNTDLEIEVVTRATYS